MEELNAIPAKTWADQVEVVFEGQVLLTEILLVVFDLFVILIYIVSFLCMHMYMNIFKEYNFYFF